MTPDLKALAERYDPKSRDTYLSLYADLSDPRYGTRLDARAKDIRAALKGDADAERAFDAAFDEARGALGALRGTHGARGAAVFVAPEHGFHEAHPLNETIPTALVLDSGPYVRPLARFLDEYAEFALVLLDAQDAAVYIVDAAKAEFVGREKTRLIGRHTKGGMSQMRYQRHRQGVVDKYYDGVAEHVAAIFREGEADRIIIAGPGQAKRDFLARLPRTLAEAVVAVEDADFADDSTDVLVRRLVGVARTLESKDSADAVASLQTALKRGELALTGPFDVVRAARDGRVGLLLILKDAKAGGAKCEEHQSFFEVGATCSCGSKGTNVDLLNEAVEHAVRSDAVVEFVDRPNAFMDEVEGVGALLRW